MKKRWSFCAFGMCVIAIVVGIMGASPSVGSIPLRVLSDFEAQQAWGGSCKKEVDCKQAYTEGQSSCG